MTLCVDCHVRPAVVKRGKQAVCVDCYNEQPIAPLAQWDKIVTPARILAMEAEIAELELRADEYEKTLIGLGPILKDMNTLDKIIVERLERLERIIAGREADS